MTIGIEAERANSDFKTGVEHYAKQLILHLAKIDHHNTYFLYLRTQPKDWLRQLPPNFSVKVIPFPIFWTQLRISWEMFWHPVDVLFIPASALPLIHPKKTLVTIHDLAWKFYPDSFTRFNRQFLEYSTGLAVKKAWRIIAVSESTKQDLLRFYRVNESKVGVVHHGYEEMKEETKKSTLTSQTPSSVPYVLFLSTLQPRKNLEGLIDAFKELKKDYPELPHKLVVVGKLGWKFQPILEKISANKDIVSYLNYLPDDRRIEVLKHADLLVLPSFYEGFGMTILEAFAAGVPVATSNSSSMPEIAGDAAVYFDPHDRTQIKNAMKNILMDRSLSESLKQKGDHRLKDFSWDKCAQETLTNFIHV